MHGHIHRTGVWHYSLHERTTFRHDGNECRSCTFVCGCYLLLWQQQDFWCVINGIKAKEKHELVVCFNRLQIDFLTKLKNGTLDWPYGGYSVRCGCVAAEPVTEPGGTPAINSSTWTSSASNTATQTSSTVSLCHLACLVGYQGFHFVLVGGGDWKVEGGTQGVPLAGVVPFLLGNLP